MTQLLTFEEQRLLYSTKEQLLELPSIREILRHSFVFPKYHYGVVYFSDWNRFFKSSPRYLNNNLAGSYRARLSDSTSRREQDLFFGKFSEMIALADFGDFLYSHDLFYRKVQMTSYEKWWVSTLLCCTCAQNQLRFFENLNLYFRYSLRAELGV